MNPLKILSKNEKTEIESQLRNQFGISQIPGILLKSGTERIFLFQGSLSIADIKKLESWIPIERVGVYFAKIQGGQIRLSIEGVHALQDQITKNIFQLNEEQAEQWMHGSELNIKAEPQGFVVMKHKEDFLGTGKASAEKITNFIPKSRRLKNKS